MALIILATLALCPLAGWLGGCGVRRARWLAVWPVLVAGWVGRAFASALGGRIASDEVAWIPSLGLSLAFRLDGLASLLASLVAGIGALVVLYAADYLDGHPQAGRFQATLFAFMAAMLGVVTTDNVYALFVFWELTGFTSFLLIGFEHESPGARRSALQALIVTGSGGLALLAAAVWLAQAAGTASLSAICAHPERLAAHPAHTLALGAVLLAAFTKSAQFPFHFWLPSAMAAPTPVSAYLHSATMVKAGVYLVARLSPAFGGHPLWTPLVAGVGGITMLGASWRAVRETDLKRILAYSTVGALGTLFLLLGLGTEASVTAALVYLLAHAGYKGSLFMVAGSVDHAAGTRDIERLSGLRRRLPLTAAAGALAAVSMAGVPPLLGFLAKEEAYAAALAGPAGYLVVAALVVAGSLLGAAGLIVGVGPFVGELDAGHEGAHEGPAGWWLGALVLAAAGLLGAFGGLLAGPLSLAAGDVVGQRVERQLSLWHGLSLPLLLSAATLGLTALVYVSRAGLRRRSWPRPLGTGRLFDLGLRGLDAVASRLAPALQDGSLVAYTLAFVFSTGVLLGAALLFAGELPVPEELLSVRVHEALVTLLTVGAALSAARARTAMAAVLSLGTAGYAVALTFLLFGAPDLAMTQFAVETLTAVIFVFVFWQIGHTEDRTTRRAKRRDAAVATAFGGLIALLTLATATHPTNTRLRDFYAEAAPTLAHGRNIVNVLLVDFRALDTLGEITVLVTAAIGVSALLKIAAAQREKP